MKIAFVYDAVYPYKIGGVEKRIWELSRRLAARGHEVHVFGMKFWDGPSVIQREGVYFHGVCRKMPFHTSNDGGRAIFPALWFSLSLIFPLMRSGRFDAIDCQNFPYFPCFSAKFVSMIRRSPLCITWHEVWGEYWVEYLGWKGSFGKVIEKMTAELTGNVVAVSPTTKLKLQSSGVKRSIAIVPNGVDFEKIRMIPASHEKSDIIFVGRLIKDKHVEVLIGAIRILHPDFPHLRCFIIGKGPEEEGLKAQVSTANLANNVFFMGYARNHDEVVRLLKSSRMCVLPSTREGFGMVALEALACGIPVLTADHPDNAVRDLVECGGVRMIPLTKKDFAEAIKKEIITSSAGGFVCPEDRWDWGSVTDRWVQGVGEITVHDLS